MQSLEHRHLLQFDPSKFEHSPPLILQLIDVFTMCRNLLFLSHSLKHEKTQLFLLLLAVSCHLRDNFEASEKYTLHCVFDNLEEKLNDMISFSLIADRRNEYMVLAKANNSICLDKEQFFNYVFYTPSPYLYMVCSEGHSTLVKCDKNQIFIPGRKCVDAAPYNIGMRSWILYRLDTQVWSL